MRTIGVITTIVAIAAAVGGVAIAVANRKDVTRYIRLRRM